MWFGLEVGAEGIGVRSVVLNVTRPLSKKYAAGRHLFLRPSVTSGEAEFFELCPLHSTTIFRHLVRRENIP